MGQGGAAPKERGTPVALHEKGNGSQRPGFTAGPVPEVNGPSPPHSHSHSHSHPHSHSHSSSLSHSHSFSLSHSLSLLLTLSLPLIHTKRCVPALHTTQSGCTNPVVRWLFPFIIRERTSFYSISTPGKNTPCSYRVRALYTHISHSWPEEEALREVFH